MTLTLIAIVIVITIVGHIDEEDPSFLLVLLLGEEDLCRVHRALYPGF